MASKQSALYKILTAHFGRVPMTSVGTAARTFPMASRVDVIQALTAFFKPRKAVLLGVHAPDSHQTVTFADLCAQRYAPVEVGPLQQEEVDTGEPEPVRCLKNGIWLDKEKALPFVVLVSPSLRYSMPCGVHIELAVPQGSAGHEFAQAFFRDLERRIAAGRSYRGKVISLESEHEYSGRAGSVKVHRLRTVQRDDVILPAKTVSLLDRNVRNFIESRERLKKMGLSGKKGLLFYGPPGTGKTHTIHYLAGTLPGHTTLVITAEQVGLLDEYFRLARFLQPTMVVIEDVDLIARARERMGSVCEEVLLNKLLNEMDGLREDADVIFVLTTNRPDQLEAALAARPGRIDQAIEFPLPDEEGRRKLLRLYGRGLKLEEPLEDIAVQRTKGASAAFIKELVRRAAQFQLELNGDGSLDSRSLDAAFEEMLFSGGSLNRKVLGGATAEVSAAAFSSEAQA